MIGRTLGIGVRVAGRIASQRLAAHAASGPGAPQAQALSSQTLAAPPAQDRAAAQRVRQITTQTRRGVSQGIGGFLRPFRRVGGMLWLEVTGALFLLPVIVFAPTLWRAGLAYSHTGDHKTFWITALVMAGFLYLGVSSFWRARRR